MKKIRLTQKKYTLVDDEDFEFLNQWKWYTKKSRNTFYAIRNSPWVNGKHYGICMHHEIMGRPPKGLMIDHENGRGLDNQRKNLRLVTHRQNLQNRIKKSSSQYPGVTWVKANKKWMAQIVVNRERKYLGYYIDEFDAFKAYEQVVNAIGEEIIGELGCL